MCFSYFAKFCSWLRQAESRLLVPAFLEIERLVTERSVELATQVWDIFTSDRLVRSGSVFLPAQYLVLKLVPWLVYTEADWS